VKKTRLTDFDSNRSGGIIAINLRDGDELISAQLAADDSDLMLVSRRGYSVRFTANDATLRPMGRATGGVIGMRFKSEDDHLLSMDVVVEGSSLVTVTDGGYGKRTPVDEWNAKGRGTQGVRAMRLVEERGGLVGALVCQDDDEIYSIATNGVVIRTRVSEVKATGRDTMGVRLQALPVGEAVVAVARALAEQGADDDAVEGDEPEDGAQESEGTPEALAEGASEGEG